MTRRFQLAAMVAAVFGAGPALAQYDLPVSRPPANPARTNGDPKPIYKYELKPENGEFLVYVKAYQAPEAGDAVGQSRELAEGLAEWIRTECRLYAFVHERGWLQRREQVKEKETVIKAIRDFYTPKGWTEEQIARVIKRDVKYARIPDEYVVYAAPGKGDLKTFDEAMAFAKYVHKLASPPDRFCDAVFVGGEREAGRGAGQRSNPFEKAIPGRNPTLPKKITAAERPKADDFLMNLNSGQSYSLIHKTKKDFTLVVQSYGAKNGIGQLVKPGEVVQTGGRSDGELLERAAQQATELAKVLRSWRPAYDAYVLHTKFESFVCIGEYDSKDDPQLLALQKHVAGMQLTDGKTKQVIETLMEKPLPAMIPRP